ncbi:MAG: hypothetical protein EOQ33_31945 [Mesorhizobium sp.]|nr:MAG: hypothetical protein EOQ33_31945 [Mesorhizobium sp.]
MHFHLRMTALAAEADKLFESLKPLVGESMGPHVGPISELSLGGANLIYLRLKLLEFKYQKTAGGRLLGRHRLGRAVPESLQEVWRRDRPQARLRRPLLAQDVVLRPALGQLPHGRSAALADLFRGPRLARHPQRQPGVRQADGGCARRARREQAQRHVRRMPGAAIPRDRHGLLRHPRPDGRRNHPAARAGSAGALRHERPAVSRKGLVRLRGRAFFSCAGGSNVCGAYRTDVWLCT